MSRKAKMNHQLGFRPVSYAKITTDEPFWDQFKACVNYPLLTEKRGQCQPWPTKLSGLMPACSLTTAEQLALVMDHYRVGTLFGGAFSRQSLGISGGKTAV